MGKLTPKEYILLNNKLKKLAMENVANFICYNNTGYSKPKHLQPILDVLDSIIKGDVRKIAFSVPPQHYKSTTLLNFIALDLLINPHKITAYTSYSQTFSEDQTRKAIRIYKKMNPNYKALVDTGRSLILESGGGLLSTSVDGALTGYGIDTLIIDDPIKNRIEAESITYRNKTWDWWLSVGKTRVRPNKTSVIVVHTRWHLDDFIGRLKNNEPSFEFYNIPAIDENNTPLMHSLEHYLELKKADPYSFYSLYQGEPIRREGKLFNEFNLTDNIPTNYKIGIGIDLAYTQKTNSDYSCIVVTYYDTNTNQYVVVETDHWQNDITYTIQRLKQYQSKYPNTYFVMEKNGTQKAIYDLLLQHKIKIFGVEPKGDKLTRALEVSSLWNTNQVFVYNKDNSVKTTFHQQIADFSGMNDLHDDYIDALVYSFKLIKNSNKSSISISL